MAIYKTFQNRLYPSRNQKRLLYQTLETCRRWYNTCLAERKSAWEERGERTSVYAQLAQVKELKKSNPYATGVPSHVLQVVVQDLNKAFKAFFRRVKAGEKPGFPRFKGRNRFSSFGFKEYGNCFKVDGRRLRLSGIGRIALRWHRPIEAKIKSLRLVCKAGKCYACFACEIEPNPLPPTGKQIGVDVGEYHLLATSAGETIENPRWYRGEQKQLQVLQRCITGRKIGGKNRAKAVRRLQRQHEHIANRRKDFWNKLVCKLVLDYDQIALEDLQITNMVRNRHLSKSILDASWGYLKQRLMSKAAEAGRQVVLVEPSYISKTCAGCGALFEGLTLQDRWVHCVCGLSLDRDHNAALNILKRAGHIRWGISTDTSLRLPQEAVPL
jgi:putative transposase